MDTKKWDVRFLKLAEFVSNWSKDPSTKTGAVIVAPDNRVISLGYNGFPKGVEDSPERLNDRELKYKMIVHCERNALLFAKEPLIGARLYTFPFMSCTPCASMVIQSGITEVISYSNNNPRWISDFELSKKIFNEAKVSVTLYEVESD